MSKHYIGMAPGGRMALHEDGPDPDGHLQCTISMEEVNKMLMFDGVDMPTCCRDCPVREEHYSPVCDNVRCRISGKWNDKPDTLPAWCPAQAVEPVELIVSKLEKWSASELASMLTKAEKFCKIGGEENGSC